MDWTSFCLGVIATWAFCAVGFGAICLRDNWRLRRTQTAFLRHLEANKAASNHTHTIGINEFPARDQETLREAINEL